jgi:hypothetical protein
MGGSTYMCTAESGPRREYIGPMIPTRHASPCDGHPSALVKEVKTVSAGLRGDSTHKGMRMAKKPKTWMMRMMPSMRGSFLAKKVFCRRVSIHLRYCHGRA